MRVFDDAEKRVLVIAYYFPPLGLSGVQRTAKFVKYLPAYGWKPTVLTVSPPGYYAFDETLLKEVEEAGARIIRTNSLDPNRMFGKQKNLKMPSERKRRFFQFIGDTFFIPDTKIGWKARAIRKALELHKETPFDVIFATSPPQTALLIGTELKELLNLPLVLDYRDAWYKYPFKYLPTPFHKRIHRNLEKHVLTTSNHTIAANRKIKEIILANFPGHDYYDVTIIPHGFDPEDYLDINVAPRRDGKLVIAHAGLFYINRNPLAILQGMKNLLSKRPDLKDRITFKHIGTVRNEDRKLVESMGLQGTVEFTGYLEHKQCVRELAESDVTYLVLGDDFSSPGKMFEYFGVRRPILASVVDGYMKQLLMDSKNATCVPFNDARAHEEAIVELFAKHDANELAVTDAEFVDRFNRKKLTGDLAKILEHQLFLDVKSSLVIKNDSR